MFLLAPRTIWRMKFGPSNGGSSPAWSPRRLESHIPSGLLKLVSPLDALLVFFFFFIHLTSVGDL